MSAFYILLYCKIWYISQTINLNSESMLKHPRIRHGTPLLAGVLEKSDLTNAFCLSIVEIKKIQSKRRQGMTTTTAHSEMPEWMAKGLQELWAYLKEAEEKRKQLEEERQKREEEARREQKQWQKRIQKLENLFTTQWGKLVEALVEPGALDLFRKRGIKVRQSARRVEVEDDEGRVIAEYDILLENDNEAVVIEVKTTVTKEDVDYLLEKLSHFKERSPRFRDYRVYGAIAGISFHEGLDWYAYKNGLFVLKSEGGVIRIANDEGFQPRAW